MFFASCNNKDSPSSPTSFSGSDRELGAEPALAVPTAYGTLGWKPFGEDAIFSADDPDADADALVSAEVRRENGRSRLYVGGKEELPMGFFGVTVQGGVMEEAANNAWAQMYQSGAKIIFTDTVVTMDEDARYTRLKGELEGILETNPDAYIVIRYTPIGRLSFHARRRVIGWFTRTAPRPAPVPWHPIPGLRARWTSLASWWTLSPRMSSSLPG